MTWTGVAVVGAAVVGGVASNMAAKKSASAARDAANTSAGAANNATALQEEMYQQTREDQAPWRDVGASGVNQLAYLMGLPSKGFETGKVGPSKMGAVTAENFDPAAYLAANPDVAANQYFRQNPAEHFDRYGFSEGRQQMLPGEKIYTQTAPVAGTGERGSLAKIYTQTAPFALSDFRKDPGYDFRLSEGIKALDRSAAARGGLLSGAQLKGLNRYNQDYASNEYQNAYNRYQSNQTNQFNRYQINQTNQFNRLAAISGIGQTANNALQQAGGQYATNASNIGMTNAANVGNAQLAAGQATASAYQGYGNALSGLARNYANYSYNNPSGSSGSSGGYDPGSDWNYDDAQSNVSFYGGN
jgi:hypothetical protein